MTEHSKLPWSVESGYNDHGGKFCGLYDANGEMISGEYSLLDEADARFIERSANNHHRLIEALRIAQQYMPAMEDVPEEDYAKNTELVRSEVKLVADLLKELGDE